MQVIPHQCWAHDNCLASQQRQRDNVQCVFCTIRTELPLRKHYSVATRKCTAFCLPLKHCNFVITVVARVFKSLLVLALFEILYFLLHSFSLAFSIYLLVSQGRKRQNKEFKEFKDPIHRHYAERHYAERPYAERQYAERHIAERHKAECDIMLYATLCRTT